MLEKSQPTERRVFTSQENEFKIPAGTFSGIYKRREEFLELHEKKLQSDEVVNESSDDESDNESSNVIESFQDENISNQQALKIIDQFRKHLSKSTHNFESSIENLESIETEILGLMVNQKTILDYFKNNFFDF
ncbi:hypothetical protein BpHYR1_015166 [Brachionus plicatilis]|uniref:Uncharacterized protein n=1 Tax=Brachionus plicatilis TaxID=10195 RepID=A0A3M7RU62_BRAPC|nr:hypothetical protein BpHYR1_015166 [Brachionus plicatilis]